MCRGCEAAKRRASKFVIKTSGLQKWRIIYIPNQINYKCSTKLIADLIMCMIKIM